MKLILLCTTIFLTCAIHSQNSISPAIIARWKKSVVNIETQTKSKPQYQIDSAINSAKAAGCSKFQLDSLEQTFYTMSISGTALYCSYKGGKYLITAKHVLSDENITAQKKHDYFTLKYKWNDFEAIYPRISIRTPFDYYTTSTYLNNFAVYNDNFSVQKDSFIAKKEFYFITDSTDDGTKDGIGIISLRKKSYQPLIGLLKKNGYSPIPIEEVCKKEPLKDLDEIFTIGFPENVSVQFTLRPPPERIMEQSTAIVTPIIVKGNIAMYNSNIEHYYVDLTITPGFSGSPIIKNNKLVGIVSKVNKIRIVDDNDPSVQTLFGIGRFVTIININLLISKLKEFESLQDTTRR